MSMRLLYISQPVDDLRPWYTAKGSQMLDREKGGCPMRASVGDRIVVRGCHGGDPIRDCEVLEVRGPDGTPPYLVRWGDTGHEAILYPGSDAFVEHFEHSSSR
jgi:hypothetical protein